MEDLEDEKDCFFSIQSFMTRKLKLKSNELIIYALIHGFCQDGRSFFYGSIKYIMANTNLSKETVLTTLQSLVKKGLVIKKDVKNYTVFDKQKNAQGAQHFCLYYTAWSRQPNNAGQEIVPANEETVSEDFTGQNSVPVNEIDGSRNCTRTGQNSVPAGSKFCTRTGQEFRPNNKFDNKADINSDTSSDPKLEQKKVQSEIKAEAEPIFTELKKLFGGHLVFDDSFVPEIQELSKQFELSTGEILDYLHFVFDRANEKKPKSLTNMYYKMAKSPNIMQDFVLTLQKSENHTSKLAVCPVCGARTEMYENCSCCGFDMNDSFDKAKVDIHKQIANLSEEKRKDFEKEYQAELERQASYGISSVIQSPALRTDFQNRINAIYRKYGITA